MFNFDKIKIKGGDNRYYYVLKKKPNPNKAAEILANLNRFNIEFLEKLKKKYLYNSYDCLLESIIHPDDEFIPYKDECVNRGWMINGNSIPLNNFKYKSIYLLVTRYRPNKIKEIQPTGQHDTAWQEGKGLNIGLCLREQQSGNFNFIDPILLKFVMIHEMSHTASDILTHPRYFWKVFKLLLTEAKLLMGYEAPNYSLYPINYCSLIVNYNPMYDNTLDINN